MSFCILLIAISYFLAFSWMSSKILRQRRNGSASILDHQKLLQKSSLDERAAPNQRLVRVFGIDNAFTTTDKEYYKMFVTGVRLKLPTSSDEWRDLAGVITKDIGRELDECREGLQTNLASLVQ